MIINLCKNENELLRFEDFCLEIDGWRKYPKITKDITMN
jgi:hypothetical protein